MTTDLQPFYVDAIEAARLSGVGKTTFYENVNKKIAPQPVIVCGLKRWVVEELKRQHLTNPTTTPSAHGA